MLHKTRKLAVGVSAVLGLAGALFGAKIAFAAAAIDSVSPPAAPNTGSVRLTINGSGFLPGAAPRLVRSGQPEVPGDNVIVGTDVSYEGLGSRLRATFDLDTRPPGDWDVKVTQVDGTATCARCFAVAAEEPTVASVTPGSRGQGATDQQLTITGANFARGASVEMSQTGISLGAPTFQDTSHLTVVAQIAADAPVGPRDVSVTNTDGQSGTCSGCFVVNGAPTVASAAPASRGQGATDQDVVVSGANFVTGAEVSFGLGITVHSTEVEGPGTLRANISVSPAATPGARDITVANGDGGTSALCDDCFTINAAPGPALATPASRGQGVTDEDVTLTGTGFVDGSVVSFSGGGITVNQTTFVPGVPTGTLVANITIDADAPATARDIVVTNPDAGTGTCVDCFTVNARPRVLELDPGSRGQGAVGDVTINGADFAPGAVATLSGSGITVNSTTFVDPTHLVADISVDSAAATGPRDVSVTNEDGGTGSCNGCFRVNAKPEATSVTPGALGQRASEQNLTIRGAAFQDGADVSFSGTGISVSSVSFVDSTTLRANVSVSALALTGTRDVTVENPDGGDPAVCGACFTVNAAPEVDIPGGLDPASRGQGAAAHDITINGSGFADGAAVSLSGSGITVHSTTFESATMLVANVSVAQDATVGPRDVIVANPDAGNVTCSGCFSVAPAPTVTVADPNRRGQGAQDQDIQIAGEGFVADAVVSFGAGVTVNSAEVSSPTLLAANISVASDANDGSREIVVTNPDGGRGECDGCFTVTKGPRVTSSTPDEVNRGATNRVLVIAGSGFNDDTELDFSGAGVTLNSLNHESADTLKANVSIASDAALGARGITATNLDGGRLVCSGCLTLGDGPAVNSTTPSAALNSGLKRITVNGFGFSDGSTLRLQRTGSPDIVGTDVAFVSATQLRATFDLTWVSPGSWTVRVTAPDGDTDVCRCFSVAQGAPTLESVDPSSLAQAASHRELTLTGTGFAPGATVSISGSGLTIESLTVESPTTLTTVVSVASDAPAGGRNVTVTNTDGQEGTCTGCLTVNSRPLIDSIDPASRRQGAQDQNVTIAGDNFTSDSAASFSGTGITVNSVSFTDGDALNPRDRLGVNLSLSSSAPIGPRDVTVTNPDSGSVTCANCFTVLSSPTVASAAPAALARAVGDHDVTLIGTNFVEGAVVTFSGSGITVNSATVESPTSLVTNVSVAVGAATGSRSITVTNPDLGTATCVDCFTVNDPPTLVSVSPASSGRGADAHVVSLDGTGFADGASVSVSGGGVTVTSTDVLGATELLATLNVADDAASGTRDVTVTNSDAGSATCADCFLVTEAQGRYTALAPARILDTRTTTGGHNRKMTQRETFDVQVTGRGGVPSSGVSAVAVNVTATQPTSASFLTLYPKGAPRPTVSQVSFGRDETVPNLVVVKVGDGGKVSLYNNSGQAHVIFDVQGWYGDQPAGDVGRYQALTPDRIVDTRDGTGGRDTKLGPGQTMDVQVTGRGGVPASDVSAVVMNVTATNPTAASFLTAYPAGATKPSASNLNFVAGQTVSNRVVAKIGTGGKVKLYNNSGATHVVIDVSGWFTDSSAAGDPGSFVPLVPQRVLDTRTGLGGYSTKVGAGRSIDVQMTGVGGVPDSGVSAVVFNLTTANGTRSTYLTAYPTGTSKPPSADLNPPAGHITSNLVMVKVGDGGEVTVYNNSGETDVIADVVGYYVAP